MVEDHGNNYAHIVGVPPDDDDDNDDDDRMWLVIQGINEDDKMTVSHYL